MSELLETSDFLFHQLGRAMRDRLRADPFFANVPVYSYHEHEIESEINKALSQASGIVVVIFFVSGEPMNRNAQGAYWQPINYTVASYENPTLNRATTGSKKTGDQCLANAAVLLSHHTLYTEGGANIQSSLGPQGIRLIANPDFLEHHLDIITHGGLVATS